MPPRKRDTDEITAIKAPDFTPEQMAHFREGVRLFNHRRYWHAHEAWEAAWLPMGDEPSDDGEIFIRALIQLASGLHLKRVGRYKGARNQLRKAKDKFAVIPTHFMGIDVASLRVFTEFQARHFHDGDWVCGMMFREQDWQGTSATRP